MRKRTSFNPKRRIQADDSAASLAKLANSIRYTGNPEHKRNPGDFGLTPPTHPRPDKSLCDSVKVFCKAEAEELLKAGVEKGLISTQKRNGYPQNIWSVKDNEHPLEAQLENAELGTYHGYPIPLTDPFYGNVLEKWKSH